MTQKLKIESAAQQARLARVSNPDKAPAPPATSSGKPLHNRPAWAPKAGEVKEISAQSELFTEAEKAFLAKEGWREDSDVSPDEIHGVINQLRQQSSAAALHPDIDPTFKLDVKEVDLAKEGTDEQRQKFDDAVAAFRAQKSKQAAEASLAAEKQISPQVQAAISQPVIELVDEPLPPPAAPAKADKPDKVDTGLTNQRPANCPRCAFPLDMTTTSPPLEDREAFLESLLASKPYRKTIKLYHGRLQVTFRTLVTDELDVVFRAASARTLREKQGELAMMDVLELANRYRLYLQLVSVKAESKDGMDFSMPEVLSVAMSSTAKDGWVEPFDRAAALANVKEEDPVDATLFISRAEHAYYEAALETVRAEVEKRLFATESLPRILTTALQDFNRDVGWMEARAIDPNFMTPSEA